MNMRPVLPFLLVVVFTCPAAWAAQVSGRDRDNILAACAQTYDTCIQFCNAAYPTGTYCANNCDGAYASCINSVNLKVGKPKDQRKKQDKVIAPD